MEVFIRTILEGQMAPLRADIVELHNRFDSVENSNNSYQEQIDSITNDCAEAFGKHAQMIEKQLSNIKVNTEKTNQTLAYTNKLDSKLTDLMTKLESFEQDNSYQHASHSGKLQDLEMMSKQLNARLENIGSACEDQVSSIKLFSRQMDQETKDAIDANEKYIRSVDRLLAERLKASEEEINEKIIELSEKLRTKWNTLNLQLDNNIGRIEKSEREVSELKFLTESMFGGRTGVAGLNDDSSSPLKGGQNENDDYDNYTYNEKNSPDAADVNPRFGVSRLATISYLNEQMRDLEDKFVKKLSSKAALADVVLIKDQMSEEIRKHTRMKFLHVEKSMLSAEERHSIQIGKIHKELDTKITATYQEEAEKIAQSIPGLIKKELFVLNLEEKIQDLFDDKILNSEKSLLVRKNELEKAIDALDYKIGTELDVKMKQRYREYEILCTSEMESFLKQAALDSKQKVNEQWQRIQRWEDRLRRDVQDMKNKWCRWDAERKLSTLPTANQQLGMVVENQIKLNSEMVVDPTTGASIDQILDDKLENSMSSKLKDLQEVITHECIAKIIMQLDLHHFATKKTYAELKEKAEINGGKNMAMSGGSVVAQPGAQAKSTRLGPSSPTERSDGGRSRSPTNRWVTRELEKASKKVNDSILYEMRTSLRQNLYESFNARMQILEEKMDKCVTGLDMRLEDTADLLQDSMDQLLDERTDAIRDYIIEHFTGNHTVFKSILEDDSFQISLQRKIDEQVEFSFRTKIGTALVKDVERVVAKLYDNSIKKKILEPEGLSENMKAETPKILSKHKATSLLKTEGEGSVKLTDEQFQVLSESVSESILQSLAPKLVVEVDTNMNNKLKPVIAQIDDSAANVNSIVCQISRVLQDVIAIVVESREKDILEKSATGAGDDSPVASQPSQSTVLKGIENRSETEVVAQEKERLQKLVASANALVGATITGQSTTSFQQFHASTPAVHNMSSQSLASSLPSASVAMGQSPMGMSLGASTAKLSMMPMQVGVSSMMSQTCTMAESMTLPNVENRITDLENRITQRLQDSSSNAITIVDPPARLSGPETNNLITGEKNVITGIMSQELRMSQEHSRVSAALASPDLPISPLASKKAQGLTIKSYGGGPLPIKTAGFNAPGAVPAPENAGDAALEHAVVLNKVAPAMMLNKVDASVVFDKLMQDERFQAVIVGAGNAKTADSANVNAMNSEAFQKIAEAEERHEAQITVLEVKLQDALLALAASGDTADEETQRRIEALEGKADALDAKAESVTGAVATVAANTKEISALLQSQIENIQSNKATIQANTNKIEETATKLAALEASVNVDKLAEIASNMEENKMTMWDIDSQLKAIEQSQQELCDNLSQTEKLLTETMKRTPRKSEIATSKTELADMTTKMSQMSEKVNHFAQMAGMTDKIMELTGMTEKVNEISTKYEDLNTKYKDLSSKYEAAHEEHEAMKLDFDLIKSMKDDSQQLAEDVHLCSSNVNDLISTVAILQDQLAEAQETQKSTQKSLQGIIDNALSNVDDAIKSVPIVARASVASMKVSSLPLNEISDQKPIRESQASNNGDRKNNDEEMRGSQSSNAQTPMSDVMTPADDNAETPKNSNDSLDKNLNGSNDSLDKNLNGSNDSLDKNLEHSFDKNLNGSNDSLDKNLNGSNATSDKNLEGSHNRDSARLSAAEVGRDVNRDDFKSEVAASYAVATPISQGGSATDEVFLSTLLGLLDGNIDVRNRIKDMIAEDMALVLEECESQNKVLAEATEAALSESGDGVKALWEMLDLIQSQLDQQQAARLPSLAIIPEGSDEDHQRSGNTTISTTNKTTNISNIQGSSVMTGEMSASMINDQPLGNRGGGVGTTISGTSFTKQVDVQGLRVEGSTYDTPVSLTSPKRGFDDSHKSRRESRRSRMSDDGQGKFESEFDEAQNSKNLNQSGSLQGAASSSADVIPSAMEVLSLSAREVLNAGRDTNDTPSSVGARDNTSMAQVDVIENTSDLGFGDNKNEKTLNDFDEDAGGFFSRVSQTLFRPSIDNSNPENQAAQENLDRGLITSMSTNPMGDMLASLTTMENFFNTNNIGSDKDSSGLSSSSNTKNKNDDARNRRSSILDFGDPLYNGVADIGDGITNFGSSVFQRMSQFGIEGEHQNSILLAQRHIGEQHLLLRYQMQQIAQQVANQEGFKKIPDHENLSKSDAEKLQRLMMKNAYATMLALNTASHSLSNSQNSTQQTTQQTAEQGLLSGTQNSVQQQSLSGTQNLLNTWDNTQNTPDPTQNTPLDGTRSTPADVKSSARSSQKSSPRAKLAEQLQQNAESRQNQIAQLGNIVQSQASMRRDIRQAQINHRNAMIAAVRSAQEAMSKSIPNSSVRKSRSHLGGGERVGSPQQEKPLSVNGSQRDSSPSGRQLRKTRSIKKVFTRGIDQDIKDSKDEQMKQMQPPMQQMHSPMPMQQMYQGLPLQQQMQQGLPPQQQMQQVVQLPSYHQQGLQQVGSLSHQAIRNGRQSQSSLVPNMIGSVSNQNAAISKTTSSKSESHVLRRTVVGGQTESDVGRAGDSPSNVADRIIFSRSSMHQEQTTFEEDLNQDFMIQEGQHERVVMHSATRLGQHFSSSKKTFSSSPQSTARDSNRGSSRYSSSPRLCSGKRNRSGSPWPTLIIKKSDSSVIPRSHNDHVSRSHHLERNYNSGQRDYTVDYTVQHDYFPPGRVLPRQQHVMNVTGEISTINSTLKNSNLNSHTSVSSPLMNSIPSTIPPQIRTSIIRRNGSEQVSESKHGMMKPIRTEEIVSGIDGNEQTADEIADEMVDEVLYNALIYEHNAPPPHNEQQGTTNRSC